MIDRLSRYFSIVLLVVASLFLYNKVSLNSDSLFLDSLSTDLFSLGGFWSEWKLTPAPAYFPDMLLYFISYPILPNAVSRIFFVSAIQVYLLAFAACWLAKQINPRISKNAITFIILCLSYITIVAFKSNMWLYFYSTNNHFASLFLGLLSLGLFIKFFKHPTRWLAGWLILVNSIAYSSSAVYLICFIAPACSLMILFLIMLKRDASSTRELQVKFLYIFLLLITSIGFSWLIDACTSYHNPLVGRTKVTMIRITDSFSYFLEFLFGAFNPQDHFTFTLSISVLFAFLFLIYHALRHLKIDFLNLNISPQSCQKMRDKPYALLCCSIFLLTIIPFNITGVVLSGGLVDPIANRYFTFSMALVLILAVVFVDSYYKKNFFYIVNFFLIAILLCFELYFLKHAPLPDSRASYQAQVGYCLMQIEEEGFPLHTGVSDYWFSRAVTHYLKNRQQILPIYQDGKPFFWMSTLGPLLHPKKYNHISYNFAIVHNKMDSQFGVAVENLIKIFPKPSRIYPCPQADMQIWLYQDNSLDKKINANIESFLNTMNGNFFSTAAMLPGQTGHISGSTRLANETDHEGFLTYGPYITLKHGQYKIQLNYSAQSDLKGPIGRLEIGRFDRRLNMLHQEKIYPKTTPQKFSTIVSVPWGGIKSFEVRTFFSGSGQLRIDSLEINKI